MASISLQKIGDHLGLANSIDTLGEIEVSIERAAGALAAGLRAGYDSSILTSRLTENFAMAKPDPSSVDFETFSSHFSMETPRACAILGAAFLDATLENLLRERLTTRSNDFFRDGPAGTFHTKIELAYALSWIDEDTHHDLNIIRKIRNDFAHGFDHELDFNDQSVKDRCNNLRSSESVYEGFAECARKNPHIAKASIEAMRDAISTPRWRFLLAVETILQLLRDLPPIATATYTGPKQTRLFLSRSRREKPLGRGAAPREGGAWPVGLGGRWGQGESLGFGDCEEAGRSSEARSI